MITSSIQERLSDKTRPVFKIRAKNCQEEDCVACPVYREVTTCHNMKSFLKEHWKNV